MNDKDLRILIRYWADEASEKDLAAVERIKRLFPKESAELEEAWNMDVFELADFDREDPKELLLKRRQKEKAYNSGIYLSYRMLRYAAAITLMLAVGSAALFLKVPRTLQNSSADKQEYVLPDQSRITLDQGARLSYRSSLIGRFSRECHLSGRAHFQVRSTENDDFLVRTDHADIRVLGTRFTVSTLQDRMQLVLEEGSVRVSSTHRDQQAILDQRGGQVIAGARGIEKQNHVNQDLYFSWMDGKLQFNNCTVQEALEFLEDTWGMDLVLPDTISADYRLMGTAPTGDPDLIVEAIRLIIGAKH